MLRRSGRRWYRRCSHRTPPPSPTACRRRPPRRRRGAGIVCVSAHPGVPARPRAAPASLPLRSRPRWRLSLRPDCPSCRGIRAREVGGSAGHAMRGPRSAAETREQLGHVGDRVDGRGGCDAARGDAVPAVLAGAHEHGGQAGVARRRCRTRCRRPPSPPRRRLRRFFQCLLEERPGPSPTTVAVRSVAYSSAATNGPASSARPSPRRQYRFFWSAIRSAPSTTSRNARFSAA